MEQKKELKNKLMHTQSTNLQEISQDYTVGKG